MATAARLARVNRASRATTHHFVSAETRAARVAQAQAVHDMARALREVSRLTDEDAEAAAQGLIAWCRGDAAALGGRYAEAADKWRALARDFADTALVPLRTAG